jgi:hypothetical protein
MRTLWSPPPGSRVSGSRSAAVCRALASRTVLASKGSLRWATNRPRPCFLRVVLPIEISRRAAPPGTRFRTVSSSCRRRKPGCS